MGRGAIAYNYLTKHRHVVKVASNFYPYSRAKEALKSDGIVYRDGQVGG